MEKLKLAAGMTGEQKRYAVEAALLLGFQTETATFPVITADGEIPVPKNMEELKALWKKSTGEVPEEYESASKHTGPIFDLDFRKEKGLETIRQHARDFIAKREAPAVIPNDGKQTPMRGHPVFIAQHATATCCRECIRKWHKMQTGRELSQIQQEYLVDVIMTWIEKEMNER